MSIIPLQEQLIEWAFTWVGALVAGCVIGVLISFLVLAVYQFLERRQERMV